MLAAIIISVLVAAWAAFVIVRKYKRIKKGIYCDCCDCGCCKSCGHCPEKEKQNGTS